MLSIRLGVVTAVAALCLWGLFSLLDSLQKPGLLRSQKTAVVKGCDSLDSDEAKRECPVFFCEKALIDSKRVALAAKFSIDTDESYADGRRIRGSARSNGAPVQYFSCELRDNKIVSAEMVESSEREAPNDGS